MRRGIAVCVVALALSQTMWGATYTVQNLNSSGYHSLRWAIQKANSHAGADRITFAGGLAGSVTKPTTALDPVSDANTTFDGDLDNDGTPDIGLDGVLQPSGSALAIRTDYCVVEGLAITGFPYAGIELLNANHCTVCNCYLGVQLGGATARGSDTADVVIDTADSNVIGEPGGGNVISGGTGGYAGSKGVRIRDGQSNTIRNNTFGLKAPPNNNEALGTDGTGVDMWRIARDTVQNVIRDNTFAGLYYGVYAWDVDDNTIQGNLFGLGADGNTSRPMVGDGVRLAGGASNNRIGATTAAARNVFVASSTGYGIEISSAATANNAVQGNYFGCNAAGTARKPLHSGIILNGNAGPQLIGGTTASAANYFADNHQPDSRGVEAYFGGSGTTIRGNRFGVLPDGSNAPRDGRHVYVGGATGVVIRDNLLAGAGHGVMVGYAGFTSSADLYGNTFRSCVNAVGLLDDSTARLGSLANTSTTDDGGNLFRSSNTLFIRNQTAHAIRAEGNNFDTTVKAEIEAKITDKLDNPAYGRVDFIPLAGGVIPTGGTEPAALSLSGVAAVPTPAGAELLFSLSTPAEVTVTVLNLAGRPVAILAQDRTTAAGLQRLAWTGRTLTGTPAPAGRYLVRVTARQAGGAQASGLCSVTLR
ncbi:MAG: hypothetical protein FJX75_29015 [Armatimonadetes bacterium]|nr:hypothetical protein [Armatimonadota bacterium]